MVNSLYKYRLQSTLIIGHKYKVRNITIIIIVIIISTQISTEGESNFIFVQICYETKTHVPKCDSTVSYNGRHFREHINTKLR